MCYRGTKYPMTEIEHKLDYKRIERLGFGETIFCEGKSTIQIDAILNEAAKNTSEFLLTRLSENKFEGLSSQNKKQVEFDLASKTGFFRFKPGRRRKELVAVISAGTSDAYAAHEVIRTLEFNGIIAHRIFDVGVAGLWRLLERLEEIKRFPIVIVVAGMDAALPTVIGGLVSGVIIAVPTSVGYGVARDGETALKSCLVSCSPGITVCNIDNGYGAAIAALRVIFASESLKERT